MDAVEIQDTQPHGIDPRDNRPTGYSWGQQQIRAVVVEQRGLREATNNDLGGCRSKAGQ